ncbi:hypothetical protein DBR17_12185 [Sphingomonas sp. HMWF008]|nr:hypothetical protein DBR17_12185 [Sphingomonas sp. HMWF008]
MWGLLFRLPWWAYFALVPLLLIGAGYSYFDYSQEVAAKSEAAHRKPPAAVPIEAIKPSAGTAKVHEVVAIAQVDLARAMEMTETKRGVERHHWTVAALYPATASDAAAAPLGAMVHDGKIDDQMLVGMVIGQGPLGPVMKLDGLLTDDSSTTRAVTKAFDGRVKLPSNPLIIDTFVEGREAGLKPNEGGFYIAIIAAIAALGALGMGLYRRSQRIVAE